MENIKVWVGDLAKYNEGELIGEWFTLPMDIGEILDEVLTHSDHEYFIADIESVINVDGLSLSQINEFAEKLESMEECEREALKAVINSGFTNDIEEAFQIVEDGDYMIYNDCSDMSDVAYQWYEETGMLSELEKHINSSYIDWDSIGSDMEIEGYFYQTDFKTYVQIMR